MFRLIGIVQKLLLLAAPAMVLLAAKSSWAGGGGGGPEGDEQAEFTWVVGFAGLFIGIAFFIVATIFEGREKKLRIVDPKRQELLKESIKRALEKKVSPASDRPYILKMS